MAALSSTTTTTTITHGRNYQGENLPQSLQINISPSESCVSLSFGKPKRKLETTDVLTSNAQNKQEELNPTFFLFLAAPSTASLAYEAISGTFGLGSKMPYSLSLFLFASMVVHINFFGRSRFSVAWWAYVFPVTTVAIASIRYSEDVRSPVVKFAAFIFSVLSVGIVIVLLVTAVIHYVLSRHGKSSQQKLCMYPMPFKKRKI